MSINKKALFLFINLIIMISRSMLNSEQQNRKAELFTCLATVFAS
jgi:hypothetical protein